MSVARLNTTVVLTVSQASELAQVSDPTIRREIAAGRLPARRIGRYLRITRAAFDRWLYGADDVVGPVTAMPPPSRAATRRRPVQPVAAPPILNI